MLEIYNDSLNDLLAKKIRTGPPLEIRTQGRSASVPGLIQVPVQTQDDIFVVMETGEKNRKMASTKMNIERWVVLMREPFPDVTTGSHLLVHDCQG